MEFHYTVKVEDQIINQLTLEEIEDEARKEFNEHLKDFIRTIKLKRGWLKAHGETPPDDAA